MILPRKSLPQPTNGSALRASRSQSHAETESGAYNREFWLTYGANLALMTAFAVLYRYADFVKFLGGSELLLGWIVGLGMVGSLAMRLVQGVGMDLYGVRRVWLLSIAGFIVACLGHLLVFSAHGPAIFLLRMLFNSSIAGFFGSTITFISRRAPVNRIAEVVGTLGTSGFIGMVSGSAIGDWLFAGGPPARGDLDRMFLVAAGLGCVSLVLSAAATHGHVPPIRRRPQPPLLWLLRRYHPGAVLATGVAMGFGLGLPAVFLRPYTESIGIERIAVFFAVYTGFAFAARIATRRFPHLIGIRPMILIGLVFLTVSVLLYLPVRSAWQLMWPAVLLGIAHAVLFPAVIAGGSAGFPARYRGLGTTLILAMFDVGLLFGYPLVGGILQTAGAAGLPKYPTMFLTAASLLALITVYYVWASRGRPRRRRTMAPTLAGGKAPSGANRIAPMATAGESSSSSRCGAS